MKKVIVIIIAVLVLLCILFMGLFIWFNRACTAITLDINPSILIYLNRNNKVIKAKPLNDDAKVINMSDIKGKTLNESLNIIVNDLVDKEFILKDKPNNIILYTKGNLNNKVVEEQLSEALIKNNVNSNIIVIDNVSKEAEQLAKKYQISVAKASYINEIIKDNENIKIDNLVDKSANELNETKSTGKYCPKDYNLEGDFCLKAIKHQTATKGMICPDGYYDYNNTCYKEDMIIDTGKVYCHEGFTLDNDDCIKQESHPAKVTSYSCSKGMVRTKDEVGMTDKNAGNRNEPVCVDTNVTHPVTVCELPASDPTERMSYGGKCYWHRAPVIPEGCPGKIKVNGECWDLATGIYLCPGGNNAYTRTKDDLCYTVLKSVKPTPNGYECEDSNSILEKDKCYTTIHMGPTHERTCNQGFTLIEDAKCLNLNNKVSKTNGLVCEGENARLKGNECIIYEIIEANE